jgi:thiamine biosynthesis lipoprotein
MPGALTRRNFLSFDFGDRRAPDTDHWIRVHRTAMACRFEVMLSQEDAADIPAARAALDVADDLESMLTVFRDASDVADLNRRAAREDVPVAPLLFDLLSRSAGLHAATEGAFDVTSTPLSRCWGFLARERRLPDEREIESARECVGMRHVALNADTRSVRFTREGLEVSFGAIGKGYALDCMASSMRREGARRVLLSAGRSSVLALSGRGRGWPVDVRPVLANRAVARLWIRDGAVGTSGAGEQFIEIDGRRYGHVIDPRTGRPASGVLGASVVTSAAADADALSTAFLIGGVDLARRYCDVHPGTLAILVLDAPGQPSATVGRYDGATLEMLS